jgi:dTDP-4-dehydrorhamnose reductase
VNSPLLVVGGNGLIGGALVAQCIQTGQPVIAAGRSAPSVPVPSITLDLASATWPELPASAAAVICAAITRQESCRQDPAGTRMINVTRTLALIEKLVASGSFVVFLSTNLVFDGSTPRRQPHDPPSPKTEYGRQKAEVEQALARWPERVAIVRLTKVLHTRLPLLEKWVQDLDAGRRINAFSDYFCSPIALEQTVAGILRIALEQRPGFWQFCGPEDVSYSQLAGILARARKAAADLIAAVPTPPSLMEHLPVHTTLDTTRAEKELGTEFPSAQTVIRDLNR